MDDLKLFNRTESIFSNDLNELENTITGLINKSRILVVGADVRHKGAIL